MAGKGIPRRYSHHLNASSSLSKMDEAAILFRSRQFAMSMYGSMDVDLLVKALDDGMKKAGSGGGTRTSGVDSDDYIPEIKLDWNPRAKRKPGQVLKLHASYEELTSKDGAKWGWVDPIQEPSDEQRAKDWEAFIKSYNEMPKPVLKLYANGPDGKPTKQIVDEYYVEPFGLIKKPQSDHESQFEKKDIDFLNITRAVMQSMISTSSLSGIQEKSLGQTIGQLLPGQRLDLARAVARGLIVDADGKMRCPAGTPNANQFTDITMSNCGGISPKKVAGRLKRWMEGINERAEEIRRQRGIEDTASSSNSRFQEARKNVNSVDESRRRMEETEAITESVFQNLRDRNGLSIDERLTAEGFDLNDPKVQELIAVTNARHLMALEIMRENGDGPEWRRLVNDMVVRVPDPQNPGKMIYQAFTWDPDKSFGQNMVAYNNAIYQSVEALMGQQLLGRHNFGDGKGEVNVRLSDILLDKDKFDHIKAKRPDLITRADEYRNFMVKANSLVRQGNLEAALDFQSKRPEQFKGITELKAMSPTDATPMDRATLQGVLSPVPDDPSGGVKLELYTNSWSRVLKPLLESEAITVISKKASDRSPYGVSVELDFESIAALEISERQKLEAFERLISESMDAETYARSMNPVPENSIEQEVAKLIEQLQKADGEQIHALLSRYGIDSYRIPSGADLNKLVSELSRRLGVGEEVISAAWQKFSRGKMYAADMSAARAFRANGDILDAIFKARGKHDMFHELGHSLQYQSAAAFIKDFAAQNGGFPIFNNGRLARTLPADTSQWTSKEWMDAVLTTVMKNPEWLQNWPPTGVSEMEAKMLHALAGAYYQGEIDKWFKAGGGNTQEGLQVALTEAHVELFALRETGVIRGPDIDATLEYMDKALALTPGTPIDIPGRPKPTPQPAPPSQPPALPPGTPGTPNTPTPPSTPGGGGPGSGGNTYNVTIGDTIINNSGSTNINVNGNDNVVINVGDVVVNGPIFVDGKEIDKDGNVKVEVHVHINYPQGAAGGKTKKPRPRKPAQPKPKPEKPESKQDKASRDLWRRINGYISEDGATEWKVAPTARGLRPGNDRSQQKTFIDEVFGLSADDTSVGGAGDAVADPFGSTQAYKSMSPDQLDARYEKLKEQVDSLIDESRSRPLTKDEQAKVWLGIKGMRQVIRENQERAQYTDATRTKIATSKRQPDQRPGKYLSKTDATSSVLSTKTATSVRRRSLEKARAQRGDDVIEVDEDELLHHQRTIAKHAGSATTGRDGWSAKDNEYESGKALESASHVLEDVPAEKTKDGKPRKRRPSSKTAPGEFGKSEREKTESKLEKEEFDAISGSIAIDERASSKSMASPESLANAIKESTRARRASITGGEKPAKVSPDAESQLLDEEISGSLAPSLRVLDKSTLTDDVEIHLGLPDSPEFSEFGQGEIIGSSEMIRGRMVSYADSEFLGSGELSATRRVRVIAPAGTRGLTQKNHSDGDVSDVILPPGEFVIVDIDDDGTLTMIPHTQETSLQSLRRMVSDLDSVMPTLSKEEKAEAKKIRAVLNAEMRKSQESYDVSDAPIGSKSITRGISGDIGAAKRGRSRNVSLSQEFAETGSKPFNPDSEYVSMIREMTGQVALRAHWSQFPPSSRNEVKKFHSDALMEEIISIQDLLNLMGTDDEMPIPDFITPQIRDSLSSKSPQEVADIISKTLVDFHNGFDERIRIDLDEDGLNDLISNGRIRTLSEIKPSSSAAQMRESFETSVGFSPDVDASSRTISGRLVHRRSDVNSAESLASSSKNGLRSSPEFLSNKKRGKEVIEVVALPEVSQRSSYSRGKAIKNKDALSPVLSQDKDDVLIALGNMTDGTSESKQQAISRIINAALTNNIDSLFGSSDQDGFGSDGFEALIPGGIDFTEIQQIRVPASMLAPSSSRVFENAVSNSKDISDAFRENGFSSEQQKRIIEMVESGDLADLIPAAQLLKQRDAAKNVVKQFNDRHGSSIELRFTRPDGIDLMDEKSFTAFPGADAVGTADEALAYRSAVEIATNVDKIKQSIANPVSTKNKSSTSSVGEILAGNSSPSRANTESRTERGMATRTIIPNEADSSVAQGDSLDVDSPIEGSRSRTNQIGNIIEDISPRADRALRALEDAIPDNQKESFNSLKERLKNLNPSDYATMITALSAIYSKSSLPGASKLKEIFGGKIQELLNNPQLMMEIIDALGFLNRGRNGSTSGAKPSKMEMVKIIGKLLALFTSGTKSLHGNIMNTPEAQDLFADLFMAILNNSLQDDYIYEEQI